MNKTIAERHVEENLKAKRLIQELCEYLDRTLAQPGEWAWTQILQHCPLELVRPTRVSQQVHVKTATYAAQGTIVAEFKTLKGNQRYVVEFAEPEGLLHIHNGDQLIPKMPE